MRRLALALAAACAAPASVAAEKARPNVIVVDICSARTDHFSVYGYARDTTPGLKRISRDTAVFDQAVGQSSWCLPNYASLFTGMTAEVHGRYTNDPLARPLMPLTTLAEKMKEAGYATAAFTSGVYLTPIWGLDGGFDTYVSDFSTATALPGRVSRSLPKALRWIAEHRGKAPYFLYLSVDDLHAPYQSDDPDFYDRGYSGVASDTETLNVGFFRAFNSPDPQDARYRRVREFKSDPRHLEHLIARYDAAVRDVDAGVSRLAAELKKMGAWDDTVVVITADHGEMLGEKGLLGHTEGLYEGALRVPLMIHYAGMPAQGHRLSQLVERVDLMPTLLDIAGASYSGLELQGRSLLPLLRDPRALWRPWAFASSKRDLPTVLPADLAIDERVIRSSSWKLHFYLYKDAFELYDLGADPNETRDLSGERPDVVGRLSFELFRHFELARPHAPGLPSGGIRQAPREPSLDRPVSHE